MQIRVAFDQRDEAALMTWLGARADLLALPASAFIDPVPLPMAPLTIVESVRPTESTRHLLFDRPLAVEMVRNGVRHEDRGVVVFTSPGMSGRWIEWSRTVRDAAGTYVPTGASGSRVYYRVPNVVTEDSARTASLARALLNRIRRSSPWVSKGRHPIRIGASLGQRVQVGEAKLATPNGTPIEIVSNPQHARSR